MGFINIIILVFVMSWTWCVSKKPNLIPQDVHLKIQSELKTVISQYIKEKLPRSEALEFHKFWTQSLSEKEIKASFSYSFTNEEDATGPIITSIKGSAFLVKNEQSWDLEKLHITDNDLEFSEPISIRPDSENE